MQYFVTNHTSYQSMFTMFFIVSFFLFSAGFVIYFLYGMRHSSENRPLSAYSQIVSYAGTSGQGGLPEGALPEPGAGMVGPSPGQLLEEKVQPQQPRNELRDISEEEDN